MDRRKIFVLVALLFVAVPLMATVCDDVSQSLPGCNPGCITAAQMAALLSITVGQANSCLKDLKDAGLATECTPAGGGHGYCRTPSGRPAGASEL
ncbi:MAG TPA: hypothetical protein VGS07_26960 [Thermoanaerobaculia bacterium]|jgi:hypothetical protein|nr:hypothetical protein [Thermoanaerobaculia bacterium]